MRASFIPPRLPHFDTRQPALNRLSHFLRPLVFFLTSELFPAVAFPTVPSRELVQLNCEHVLFGDVACTVYAGSLSGGLSIRP